MEYVQVLFSWRRAVIIVIPKAGKDPKLKSHRLTALISHVSRLAEHDGPVLPVQVGGGEPFKTGAADPLRLKQAQIEGPADRGKNGREVRCPRLSFLSRR